MKLLILTCLMAAALAMPVSTMEKKFYSLVRNDPPAAHT